MGVRAPRAADRRLRPGHRHGARYPRRDIEPRAGRRRGRCPAEIVSAEDLTAHRRSDLQRYLDPAGRRGQIGHDVSREGHHREGRGVPHPNVSAPLDPGRVTTRGQNSRCKSEATAAHCYCGHDQSWVRQGSASAVEHRPTDVVAGPLVTKYELADRLREVIALPLALESPCGLAQARRYRCTSGLDRVGGCAELVRGDVSDGPGLAGGVRGMPCCPTQVSGCPHRMAARRASLHHLDLAAHPGPDMLDRLARSLVPRLGRLEEAKDVFCTRGSP
jgi:hypothetical protein